MITLQKHVTAIAVLTGSLLFTSCTNTPAEQKQETDKKLDKLEDRVADVTAAKPATWEDERRDVLHDLQDLRNSIDKKLEETNAKLEDKKLKPADRTEATAFKEELNDEKNAVARLIKQAEDSDESTWDKTKATIKLGSDDVKAWWARLKDNVDKKTDSDKDNDGH